MFGTQELFNYILCENCNCLQINSIPPNLDIYYPENYYSFNNTRNSTIKYRVKKTIYKILSAFKGDFYEPPSFKKYGLLFNDRKKEILDIGCGDGKLLYELNENGFTHLTGIDPNAKFEIQIRSIKLFKKELGDLRGQFDIIMSHHSLEHMPDPDMVFKSVNRLLKTSGRLILRIPIFPNYIWEKYQTNWIQLDPPRHIYTFSLKGIDILCKNNGLSIVSIEYDGEPWSIASTEYCLNGRSHREFEQNYQLAPHHITECQKANETNRGDSVCMIIRKVPNV
jgi:SAM-dependent methyltransferase